jgi:hypothetical protein
MYYTLHLAEPGTGAAYREDPLLLQGFTAKVIGLGLLVCVLLFWVAFAPIQ